MVSVIFCVLRSTGEAPYLSLQASWLLKPCSLNFVLNVTVKHLSMSSRQGGGRRGIGPDFDWSLWPGDRVFEFSCCPWGRDIWIFVHAHDHKSFLGVGNLVIFDLTFLPGGGKFDSNLLENVKIPPYAQEVISWGFFCEGGGWRGGTNCCISPFTTKGSPFDEQNHLMLDRAKSTSHLGWWKG